MYTHICVCYICVYNTHIYGCVIYVYIKHIDVQGTLYKTTRADPHRSLSDIRASSLRAADPGIHSNTPKANLRPNNNSRDKSKSIVAPFLFSPPQINLNVNKLVHCFGGFSLGGRYICIQIAICSNTVPTFESYHAFHCLTTFSDYCTPDSLPFSHL